MPHRRCLTCLFWLPAYHEDDLRAAERALEARRGFGAALAGACVAPGRGRHVSSRHACDRWAAPAHAHRHAALLPAYRLPEVVVAPLPSPELPFTAGAAAVKSATASA